MVKEGHKVVVAGLCHWGYGEDDYYNDEGVEVYRYRYTLAGPWLQKQDKISARLAYKVLDVSGLFHLDIKNTLKKYKGFLEGLIVKYNIGLVEMPDYKDYMR